MVSVLTASVPRGLRVRREICRKDPGGGFQGMPGAGEHVCSVLLRSQPVVFCYVEERTLENLAEASNQ